MREAADVRARRLLVEGRLRVLEASEDNGYIAATCRGDSGSEWDVAYEDGAWRCECPAWGYGKRCAHVRALQLVCVMEPRRATP